jgi:PPM family protein phosphatase
MVAGQPTTFLPSFDREKVSPSHAVERHHLANSVHVAGSSDIGRLRKRNEDSLALASDLGIAVVADGMGGHPGGDVASRIAADEALALLREAVESSARSASWKAQIHSLMDEAVRSAHALIRERGVADPHLDGMGTTLTAMVADSETGAFVVGHVGDSRAYLFRGGVLSQVTRDDTWVQQQIDNDVMDAEQARRSPYAHLLTQCLGLEDEPRPQVFTGEGKSGDAYLLCTDGLVGMLTDSELTDILVKHLAASGPSTEDQANRALDAMLTAANEAGGHDNITAALICFG